MAATTGRGGGGGGAFFGRGGLLFAAKTGPLGPLLATENGPRVHFWQQKVDRGAPKSGLGGPF